MQKMISLYEWAKREGVAYSQAQKMFAAGSLRGAVREGRYTRVPDSLRHERHGVTCAVCGVVFPQITGTHLRGHGMTPEDYREAFPESPMIADAVIETIRSKITGTVRSEETRQRVSEGRTGIRPKDHPRFVKGAYRPSAETRRKMSEAHKGKTHDEATKAKIGARHKGKTTPEHVREAALAGYRKRFPEGGYWSGKTMAPAAREKMAVAAIRREAEYAPERRMVIKRNKAAAQIGKVRTPEQRDRYSEARSRYMEENATKLASTKGERTIIAWLEARGVAYRRQFRVKGIRHPFDFYLPAYNIIIEFDGAHHWLSPWFGVKGKTPEEIVAMLEAQRQKDAEHNLLVGRAGYRIVRLYGRNDVGDVSEWPSFDDQITYQMPEFVSWRPGDSGAVRSD